MFPLHSYDLVFQAVKVRYKNSKVMSSKILLKYLEKRFCCSERAIVLKNVAIKPPGKCLEKLWVYCLQR